MAVSPDFFKTLSIPLLEGRLLDSRDRLGSPDTIVVNETFRRRLFPGETPLGRRISIGVVGACDVPTTAVSPIKPRVESSNQNGCLNV